MGAVADNGIYIQVVANASGLTTTIHTYTCIYIQFLLHMHVAFRASGISLIGAFGAR